MEYGEGMILRQGKVVPYRTAVPMICIRCIVQARMGGFVLYGSVFRARSKSSMTQVGPINVIRTSRCGSSLEVFRRNVSIWIPVSFLPSLSSVSRSCLEDLSRQFGATLELSLLCSQRLAIDKSLQTKEIL